MHGISAPREPCVGRPRLRPYDGGGGGGGSGLEASGPLPTRCRSDLSMTTLRLEGKSESVKEVDVNGLELCSVVLGPLARHTHRERQACRRAQSCQETKTCPRAAVRRCARRERSLYTYVMMPALAHNGQVR
jgi:hypothetical protein